MRVTIITGRIQLSTIVITSIQVTSREAVRQRSGLLRLHQAAHHGLIGVAVQVLGQTVARHVRQAVVSHTVHRRGPAAEIRIVHHREVTVRQADHIAARAEVIQAQAGIKIRYKSGRPQGHSLYVYVGSFKKITSSFS